MSRLGLLVLLMAGLTGCNTVNRGTTQVMTVRRDPPDAACSVQHSPDQSATPFTGDTVTVERTRFPVIFTCSRPGYQDARVERLPMVSNVLPGGVFNLIDMSTGANNSYPPVTRITLEKATN